MMMLTKLANLMIDNLDLQIQQKGQYIYARLGRYLNVVVKLQLLDKMEIKYSNS